MQVFFILGQKLFQFLFNLKTHTQWNNIVQLVCINNIYKRTEDMHVNERHAKLSKDKYSYHLLHINCLHFMSKVLKSNI